MLGDSAGSAYDADVAIIGAGPIGLELAAGLKAAGVDYVQFEAGQIGQTIFQWPPETRFFSSPERVTIAHVPFQTADQLKLRKEDYLSYLRAVVEQLDLDVRRYERVVAIERCGEGFSLATSARGGARQYRCRRVVLATGGLARPNLLEIPGEDLPHVSHYVGDPHQYFGTRLVIVGGMNSALEAALRSYRAGAKVTISYRRAELGRDAAKKHLTAEVGMFVGEGKITVLPETVPVEITPEHIVLTSTSDGRLVEGPRIRQPADFVLLCTGFVADMQLFAAAGVRLEGPRQVPCYDPETLETNVPGLYVAGTAAGGTQHKFQLFIETCHVHVDRLVTALSGRPPARSFASQVGPLNSPSEDAET